MPGGVTFEQAKHTAVLSLGALRKLHFPVDGTGDASPDARFVIAAIGLFALTAFPVAPVLTSFGGVTAEGCRLACAFTR